MRTHSQIEEIEMFELLHGVKFPADYKTHIQDGHAYYDKVFSFVLPGSTDADKRYFRGFFNASTLGEIRNQFRDAIPKELVAVGSCTDDDFICLGVSGDVRGAVYLFKHSDNEPLTAWSHLERIADSLTAFLQGLTLKEHETIAQAAIQAFGEAYDVQGMESRSSPDTGVDVLVTRPSKHHKYIMAATIGLSDVSSGIPYDEKPIRLELVGMVKNQHKFPELLPRILAGCAFFLMNSRDEFNPIMICENAFGDIRSRMEHILLMPQFLFTDLRPVDFQDKEVRWLLAVPISTREKRYALKHGLAALNDLFAEHNIEVADLKRKSVV